MAPGRKASVDKLDYKSQMERTVHGLGEEDGDGLQMSDRDLLASERAKREKNDLMPSARPDSDFEVELISGDNMLGELDSDGVQRRPQPSPLMKIQVPNTPHGLNISALDAK